MESPEETTQATTAPVPWGPSPWLIVVGTTLFASLVGFGWTLDSYFIAGDFAYFGRFHNYSLTAWPELFVREWSAGIWGRTLPELRPLTALSRSDSVEERRTVWRG